MNKLIIGLLIVLAGCKSSKMTMENKTGSEANFEIITELFPPDEFERIKEFIINHGDRKTYRNFDSNNPHYRFTDFDIFLGSDIGQRNITNDPAISDFNQLTILDWNSSVKYYEILIVRGGDIEKKKAWIKEGMKEEEVYLTDNYNKGLALLKNDLIVYLKKVNEETKSR